MSDEIRAVSGAAMRALREQGMVLQFPSGNHYRVRTVSAAQLLKRGNLPNVLLAFLIDVIYEGSSTAKVDKFLANAENRDSALEFLQSLEIVCSEMFMEPRIVEHPQSDEEVTIDDIPLIDQGFAFDGLFKPTKEVLPFRAESSSDVESLAEVEIDAQAAE